MQTDDAHYARFEMSIERWTTPLTILPTKQSPIPPLPVRYCDAQTKRGQTGKQRSDRLPTTYLNYEGGTVHCCLSTRARRMSRRKIQARPYSLPYSHALEWQGMGDRAASNSISLRVSVYFFSFNPQNKSGFGHISWLQGCLSGTPGHLISTRARGRRALSMWNWETVHRSPALR